MADRNTKIVLGVGLLTGAGLVAWWLLRRKTSAPTQPPLPPTDYVALIAAATTITELNTILVALNAEYAAGNMTYITYLSFYEAYVIKYYELAAPPAARRSVQRVTTPARL